MVRNHRIAASKGVNKGKAEHKAKSMMVLSVTESIGLIK